MRVRSTLVAEGSTDCALGPILTWLLKRHLPEADVESTRVLSNDELSGIAKGDLVGRIRRAIDLYPCEILFVYRDADSEDDAPRHEEIRRAAAQRDHATSPPIIAVVPIQAVEAWLMFHADALFHAVRKRARITIDLPPLRTVQTIHRVVPHELRVSGVRRSDSLPADLLRHGRTSSTRKPRGDAQ